MIQMATVRKRRMKHDWNIISDEIAGSDVDAAFVRGQMANGVKVRI
jgi:allantoicase